MLQPTVVVRLSVLPSIYAKPRQKIIIFQPFVLVQKICCPPPQKTYLVYVNYRNVTACHKNKSYLLYCSSSGCLVIEPQVCLYTYYFINVWIYCCIGIETTVFSLVRQEKLRFPYIRRWNWYSEEISKLIPVPMYPLVMPPLYSQDHSYG